MEIFSPNVLPVLDVSGSLILSGSITFSGNEQPDRVLSAENLVTTESLAGDLPNGIVSSSAQLTGSYDQRYVLSGSITQTTWDNIANKPAGIVSSSVQVIGILEPLNTFSGSVLTKLSAIELVTQSLDQRLDSFEAVSSSYARTNVNNIFSGLQTFTNISVDGTGSFAYIQSVTGSAKIIGDAFLILNADTPAERFAGIKVVDSGSTFSTSSFLYDGLQNQWIFQHQGTENSGSSLAIFGPLSQDGLGTEVGLTQNKVPKAVTDHGHHIADSNITDTGTLITLGSNTEVIGTFKATGTTLVSSSAQLTGSFDQRYILSGSISAVQISDTPPVSPSDGNLWYNSSTGGLFIWYQDVDSGQWVDVGTSGPQGPVGPSGSAATANILEVQIFS